jgi:glycolate oxidase FAD binding subunit
MKVDGITPVAVTVPRDATELAGALASATRARQATVISGGGTKLAWGRTPSQLDLLVSTAKLNRLVAHRYGDLTATIEAGAALADVNRQLAEHGQWLPIDSAFDAATIGGIVATNDSGPLRHRFGTPRDLLIGVTLALADGRLVKAGGTVVKNVAGYDLGRLMSGSFGALAGLVTATFKLSPLPAASGTIGVLYRDADALGRDAQLLASNQFEMTALEVLSGPASAPGGGRHTAREHRLLVRFASSPVATDAQLAAAQAMVTGETQVIRDAAETALWRTQVGAPWIGEGTTLRVAWLPAALPHVLALVADVEGDTGAALTLTARAAVGAGLLRVDGSRDATLSVVERLRGRGDLVGHVVLLRAPADVKAIVDVWGPPADSAPVVRAIKQALDPAGILNAGRGPV